MGMLDLVMSRLTGAVAVGVEDHLGGVDGTHAGECCLEPSSRCLQPVCWR
jgi:hypothetical protein